MKTFTIAIAASMLFLAAPFAVADEDEEACAQPAETSYLEHPLSPDHYLWIDPTQPNRIGQWEEGNGVLGLQVAECFHLGVFWYSADLQLDVLP